MKSSIKNLLKVSAVAAVALGITLSQNSGNELDASSHREAPMIADDPLADNTDVYAFVTPGDTGLVTLIANFIPFQKSDGGPNYYSFGEDIRYEIHVKNQTANPTQDDITYRFTFFKENEDPTTFFNIRLGKENLKTTYRLERKIGALPFAIIVDSGIVPPYNIGPRSINGNPVGLGTNYETLRNNAVMTATTGETVFAGSSDDPFFVDLGAIFDLGAVRPANGTGSNKARDGLAKNNVHSLCVQVPINFLQKDGKYVSQAANILDPDFVIGVWASASRPQIRTLNTNGTLSDAGDYVQVSRLGMPLTNEVITPVGAKDRWNSRRPGAEDTISDKYLTNPELALYMDSSAFGPAVPGLAPLRIQTRSLRGLLPGFPGFDFRNGRNGVAAIKNSPLLDSTVFADGSPYEDYLLRTGRPRSVDILPIFHTGVPNARPYQLATGKIGGNPLTAGKPFIHNFLPVVGDMLRLNMAVPATSRSSADFSSLGLLQAAVLGLTDARFNGNKNLQFIPNMDGFPNGRRLEDDVTRIELQAVGGIVLAAIGLFYDDYNVTDSTASPLTPKLLATLGFNTGITENDTTFRTAFPFVQTPWRGYEYGGKPYRMPRPTAVKGNSALGLAMEANTAVNFPNPFVGSTTIRYKLAKSAPVVVNVYDIQGRLVKTLQDKNAKAGMNDMVWNSRSSKPGTYFGQIRANGEPLTTVRMVITR